MNQHQNAYVNYNQHDEVYEQVKDDSWKEWFNAILEHIQKRWNQEKAERKHSQDASMASLQIGLTTNKGSNPMDEKELGGTTFPKTVEKHDVLATQENKPPICKVVGFEDEYSIENGSLEEAKKVHNGDDHVIKGQEENKLDEISTKYDGNNAESEVSNYQICPTYCPAMSQGHHIHATQYAKVVVAKERHIVLFEDNFYIYLVHWKGFPNQQDQKAHSLQKHILSYLVCLHGFPD